MPEQGSHATCIVNIFVFRISNASCKDGPRHPEMEMAARLGARGTVAGNIARDLWNNLDQADAFWPKAQGVPLPILDNSTQPPTIRWIMWGFFLMQDVLNCLYTNCRSEFERRFLGRSHDNLRSYWQRLRKDDPRLLKHPVRSNPRWQELAIPGRFHGDGVPFGKGRNASINGMSWSSKLGLGETLDYINLWCGLPKTVLCHMEQHGVDTMEIVWNVFVWDAFSCLKGVYMRYDWNGDTWPPEHERAQLFGDIMGGLLLAMIQTAVDSEYLSNHLGFPHWNCNSPCAFCAADQGIARTNPWTDFRHGAPWKTMLVTLDAWLDKVHQHPLWRAHARIGLVLFSICLDVMHVGDKGILSYFLPSCVHTLVHESGLPGNFHARCGIVWKIVVESYVEMNVPHRDRLPRDEFYAIFGDRTGPNPPAYPEMHGKAHHLQTFLPALAKTCGRVHAQQALHLPEHKHRLECLQLLCAFYEQIKQAGELLSETESGLILANVNEFLLRQNFLDRACIHARTHIAMGLIEAMRIPSVA